MAIALPEASHGRETGFTQSTPSAELQVGDPERNGTLKLRIDVKSRSGPGGVIDRREYPIEVEGIAASDSQQQKQEKVRQKVVDALDQGDEAPEEFTVETAAGGRIVVSPGPRGGAIFDIDVKVLRDSTNEKTDVDNDSPAGEGFVPPPPSSSPPRMAQGPLPVVEHPRNMVALWLSGKVTHNSTNMTQRNFVEASFNGHEVEVDILPSDNEVMPILRRLRDRYRALGRAAEVLQVKGEPALVVRLGNGEELDHATTYNSDSGLEIGWEWFGNR